MLISGQSYVRGNGIDIGASSGIGTAAIQIAKLTGAKVMRLPVQTRN